MFSIPRPPLSLCSISLPPAGELGWGKGLGPTGPRLWYSTLFREVGSVLQVYAVWRSLLSCCSLKISCINYIFVLYVVLGRGLCLTYHAAIFNPLFEEISLNIKSIQFG